MATLDTNCGTWSRSPPNRRSSTPDPGHHYERIGVRTSSMIGNKTFERRRHAKPECKSGASCSRKQGAPMDLEIVDIRVREEFREMRGLRLTPAQATKLWGLENDFCKTVIDSLVAEAFLRWTPAGAVTRA
jgi:hypothetical protein